MLVFDELKKNDPQLRLVAMVLAAGLCILVAGLWWVQVVSAREYQSHLETQAYRSVRIPAARGKILDREGRVLAENQPSYNLSLFLDDLQKKFGDAYSQLLKQARDTQQQAIAAQEKKLGRLLTKAERKQFAFSTAQLEQLRAQARFAVANNITAQVSRKLQQPLVLNPKNFEHAYETRLALPYPILPNINVAQIARFEENFPDGLGVNLDLQSVRAYPDGTTAAHLLGYVLRDDSSKEGEDAYFNYYMPDFRGVVGVEAGFDSQLRGRAGEESLLVNSLGYRQSENVWSQPEPGHNVVLTIDLDIQRAAENSLAAHQGADARAAVVVMDVHSGDVLAMVSSPAINPIYVSNSPAYLNDPKLQPQINRATYGNYAPGSIFKPIVGLAALENGLNPNEIYDVQPDPAEPNKGCIYVGSRKIKDTVPPGAYNFRRAIEQSSNSYFVFNGLRTGIEKIVRLAGKFHFGERTALPTRQETSGIFPTLKQVQESDWRDGDSANICFGQGEMAVTPVQMAVAYSAIANGGKVLWPRLVERIEPQDPASGETATNFPSGLVRDEIGVSARSLKILREAMLSETEDAGGTGRAAVVPGLRICGKTGTAQVQNERNQLVSHNFWFASFAPYENPKYAVVVMVQSEGGGSGGSMCAPIAHDIYAEILKKENAPATPGILAKAN
ncbi:MAG TPA: penicillin-binding transpeptidase domain-containing protein [Candidatus Dormibacteraeota bacterium]|nr:penicillin-binding transpeptidase domain-containing protein [Candidatus Dormibacteraeota bacterium]